MTFEELTEEIYSGKPIDHNNSIVREIKRLENYPGLLSNFIKNFGRLEACNFKFDHKSNEFCFVKYGERVEYND